MRKTSLVILLLLSLTSFSQTATSWYKSYKGKVGSAGFTLHLHRAASMYDAWLTYDNFLQPYSLSARDQKSATLITLLRDNSRDDDEETWILRLNGASISGSCTIGKRKLAFSGTEQKNVPAVSYIYTQGEKKLNTDKNSPKATYFSSGVFFPGQEGLNELISPGNLEQKSFGEYLLDKKKEFFQTFMDENKDLKPADYAEETMAYNRDGESKTTIAYRTSKLLNTASFYYNYSGGAHGNYMTLYSVIDIKKLKLLHLADVVTDTAALVPLLEKFYRKQYHIPAGEALEESLFENSIHPSENFMMTDKCIAFSYAPYEIASYAQGEIIIYIPFTECKNILSPEVRSLIGTK